jgi:hypothetical protein
VKLPLAYSPFNRITQRGQLLQSSPDFRGLTQIVTKQPHEPAVAGLHDAAPRLAVHGSRGRCLVAGFHPAPSPRWSGQARLTSSAAFPEGHGRAFGLAVSAALEPAPQEGMHLALKQLVMSIKR